MSTTDYKVAMRLDDMAQTMKDRNRYEERQVRALERIGDLLWQHNQTVEQLLSLVSAQKEEK